MQTALTSGVIVCTRGAPDSVQHEDRGKMQRYDFTGYEDSVSSAFEAAVADLQVILSAAQHPLKTAIPKLCQNS